MRIDLETNYTRIPGLPPDVLRGTGERLAAAVRRLAGGKGDTVRHCERAWASASFTGSRHTLSLRFRGAEAIAAGERLIDVLPEHEFAIPGQVVADAAIVAVDHRFVPEPTLTVEAELLLLEEC